MTLKRCHSYYYGGLSVKGARRKGRLWIKEDMICFEVPERKGGEKVDLRIPFSKAEKIFLTRDNYYGADTVLFNLTFRDEAKKTFTLRFAPFALIPRRRIALQKKWFDHLAEAINPAAKSLDIQDPSSYTAFKKKFLINKLAAKERFHVVNK